MTDRRHPSNSATAQEVASAAYGWWLTKRPINWVLADHLEHPTINCVTPAEEALARAVAEYQFGE